MGEASYEATVMVKLDEFVTIREAAQILGVWLNTLRNWHRDGKMTVRLGRKPIYDVRHGRQNVE